MKTEQELPLNVSEFTQDTLGFDNAEIGSYILLLIDYWANARPIPNDDKYLRNVTRCPDGIWLRTKGLLSSKFDVSNGSWKQARMERAIAESKARKAAITKASALGVEARRQMGQIPNKPVGQPDGLPAVERISAEKELVRVEKRIAEIRQQGTTTATGTTYTVPQRVELKTLKDRREELRDKLGFKA